MWMSPASSHTASVKISLNLSGGNMKLATIIRNGFVPVVITDDGKHAVPVNDVLGTNYADLMDLIRDCSALKMDALKETAAANCGIRLSDVRLTSPIKRPLHDIICVGINYAAHLEEHKNHFMSGEFVVPPKAVYFGKRAIRITGPEEEIKGHLDIDERLDYEVELAVVIGDTINSDTKYEEIGNRIFGYSVFNDVSARAMQKQHEQWYYGKSMDSFCVMGPWIVTSDEISINEPLKIQSRINGEIRQNSTTGLMIRNVSDLIYDLSRGITLEAGDILATGTPSGVGQGFTPPRFMKRGDVVEAEIEKIGILRNTIR